MGLLDQVIGGVLGQVLGGGREPERGGGGHGGALGGAMSPIVQALLMLLMSKGAGGLGDLLGGGHRREAPDPRGRDEGDIGGFGQDPAQDPGRGGSSSWDRGGGYDSPRGREGDFSDLSGMLDGPGDRSAGPSPRDPGAGPYAHLDEEPHESRGGLDGLIEQFQRGGLGDVMESWIGHGENRPVAPNRLAEALGPETVGALEQRTGLNRDDLLAQLSQVLPQVVDALTPQGRRPTGADTQGW